jgi:two-component system alkaline phosphatase synthesis response regulator PhoP
MSSKGRVLIADDEENIRELLAYNLGKNGFEVLLAHDGISALAIVKASMPDLVILDVMMPGLDGYGVLSQIRSFRETTRIPVIMLTAKGADTDKVFGLEMGADDYISKPFSVSELIARVRALLRRVVSNRASGLQQYGSIGIDKRAHKAMLAGSELVLTLKEFDLLAYLAENAGLAFTREKLMEEIWGLGYYGDMRTVDVHITHLRGKLGSEAGNMIETVRGVGYRFKPEDESK